MKHIAVVGTGYWGRNLVRIYDQLGVLRTICDTREDVLEAMQEAHPGVSLTRDFRDLLRDECVKGVVIALPAECHYEFAREALEAGKDVYVEKPLALRLEDIFSRVGFRRGDRVICSDQRYAPAAFRHRCRYRTRTNQSPRRRCGGGRSSKPNSGKLISSDGRWSGRGREESIILCLARRR